MIVLFTLILPETETESEPDSNNNNNNIGIDLLINNGKTNKTINRLIKN